MKRLFSIDEIHKTLKKEDYIDIFFYKHNCSYSLIKFKKLLKNKHVKLYVLSYKIFSNMAIQFDVNVIPSIITLDNNGCKKIYQGSNEIDEYIKKKEFEYKNNTPYFNNKGTQTDNSTDSSDSEIDITYQILSPYVVTDNIAAIETNQ